MKNKLKIICLNITLLIFTLTFPFNSKAKELPSTAELWELVQKQQSQIEQQNQQIKDQNTAIQKMEANLSNQIEKSEEALLIKNDALWLDVEKKTNKEKSPFSFKGYAVANYYNYQWDTQPGKRYEADLERLVLNGKYQFNDQWSLTAEVEYEHGGTGSTMEFDVFEEFGEFEQDIEKGGKLY